ncbi:MAG: TonB-dependent receptor [Ignavibacteriales bacterium]|nr:TonB-dependent receptor [Ignavibacteriales bacterium]
MKKIILICFITLIIASNLTNALVGVDTVISGKVTSNSTPIPFANIVIKGTSVGTVSDNDGNFYLMNLPQGTYTIIVSSIGYKPIQKTIVINKSIEQKINFELEETSIEIGQVVVSANRNEMLRKEAPVVVNTITKNLFEETNSNNLGESLNYQTGLRVETNCQNCGFQQVRINGLEGTYSQILIDSRSLFSALTSVYGIEQIPTNMIERVEVIRGGGSAIFGSNAIGGIINIITKEPNYNSFQVSNNTSFISSSTLDNNISINGSLVSEDQKTGIALFGAKRNRDYYDANDDGFSEIGLIDNTTFGFRSFYKPDAFSKLTVEYHNLNEFRRGGNKFDYQPHETDITEQTEHKINNGNITYNLFSKNYKSTLCFFSAFQYTKRNSYYGAQMDLNAYGHTDDFSFVGGGQYSYNFDNLIFAPSTITTGIEYNYNSLKDNMPGYNRSVNQYVKLYGIFLQNEWKIDKVIFLFGARFDKHNLIEKIIISPRVNLLYKIKENLTSRLTYTQGYRAPQAFDEDLHIEAVGGEVMLISLADDLKQENSYSYSGSLDYDFNLFNFEANILIEGFYTKLKDVFVLEEIGSDAQGNKLVERRNGSGAEVSGICTEMKIAFSKNVKLNLGFTIQNSQYLEPEKWSDDVNVESTKKMLRSPNNYGFFTFNVMPFPSTIFSLSGVYTGEMLVPHYLGFIISDKLEKTPNFFELNLKLSQDISISKELNLQINGGIQNIFNSYQKDFDLGVYRDAGYVYGPSRPRTLFIGMKIGNIL